MPAIPAGAWYALGGLGIGGATGFAIGAGTRTLLQAAMVAGVVYVVSKYK